MIQRTTPTLTEASTALEVLRLYVQDTARLLELLYAADAEVPILGQPDHRKLAAVLGKPIPFPTGDHQ